MLQRRRERVVLAEVHISRRDRHTDFRILVQLTHVEVTGVRPGTWIPRASVLIEMTIKAEQVVFEASSFDGSLHLVFAADTEERSRLGLPSF